MENVLEINYQPEPTAKRFHESTKKIRAIIGSLGTGKTATSIVDIFAIANNQYPHNGVRRSLCVVTRNTYPEIESIIVEELKRWIPEEMMRIVYKNPVRVHIRYEHPSQDGTIVDLRLFCYGLDDKGALTKIKSLNASFGYMNEAALAPKEVFEAVLERVGRWPSPDEGGNQYGGVILDLNKADLDNWVYQDVVVNGWRDAETGEIISEVFDIPPPIFRKEGEHPGGFYYRGYTYFKNPRAEGVRFQNEGFNYWFNRLQNKSDSTIRRLYLNEWVPTKEGRPVFEEFKAERHVSRETLSPLNHQPCSAYFDWGHHAACVIVQPDDMGQLRVLDEFYRGAIGLKNLLKDHLVPALKTRYRGAHFNRVVGDPTGRADATDIDATPFLAVTECFQELGFDIICGRACAHANSPQLRFESADSLMRDTDTLLVSPHCEILIKALAGNYRYKPKKTAIGEYEPKPDKNDIHCVSTDCEIYTLERGWLKHDQLKVGDKVLGFDHDTGRLVPDICTDIHFQEDARVKVLPLVRDNHFGLLKVTDNHRHLVHLHESMRTILTTDQLDQDCSLVGVSDCSDSGLRLSSPILLFSKDRLESRSNVWCPTTKSHFWVCRLPDGLMFVTGNSHLADTFQYAALEHLNPGLVSGMGTKHDMVKRNNRRHRR